MCPTGCNALVGRTFPGDIYCAIDTHINEDAGVCIFYQDAMCPHTTRRLLDECVAQKIPVCAGGLMWAQVAPMTIGVDLITHRPKIAQALLAMAKGEEITVFEYKLAASEVYRVTFNDEMSEKSGITLNAGLGVLSEYGGVDIMRERNFAAVMDGVAHPDERQQVYEAARKQIAQMQEKMRAAAEKKRMEQGW